MRDPRLITTFPAAAGTAIIKGDQRPDQPPSYTPDPSQLVKPWVPAEENRDPAFLAARYEYLSGYYGSQTQRVEAFFRDRGYSVAGACFELLLEKRNGRTRKNNYAPAISHEIDQLLPVINFIESLTEQQIREIEKLHGPLEHWFCAIIVHDMGEDFRLFSEDLCLDLSTRLDRRNLPLIAHAAQSMERLTHYRKYDLEQFTQETGVELILPELQPGQIINLHDFCPRFWKEMNVLDGMTQANMQTFAYWNEQRKKILVIVTQYGRAEGFGPEWHLYIQSIAAGSIYDILTKMGDRIQGMSTRPAMHHQDVRPYADYLSDTQNMYSIVGIAKILKDMLYKGSPLKGCIESMNAMMGLLDAIGCSYVNHHPQSNPPGTRGFSPQHIAFLEESIGVSPFFFSRFFPKANDFYASLKSDSHPVLTILEEIREAGGEHNRVLHREMVKVLQEVGGPQLQQLLKAETVMAEIDAPDDPLVLG